MRHQSNNREGFRNGYDDGYDFWDDFNIDDPQSFYSSNANQNQDELGGQRGGQNYRKQHHLKRPLLESSYGQRQVNRHGQLLEEPVQLENYFSL